VTLARAGHVGPPARGPHDAQKEFTMSLDSDIRPASDRSTPGGSRARWPLWIFAAGLFGAISTLGLDSRAENLDGFEYPITVNHMADLDYVLFRIAGLTGYIAVTLLLIAAAVWRHKVERRFAASVGASLVTNGVIASAAALALVYGWKGALGNYMHGAMEENTYDDQGLYVLYMINDFGPFIAWVPMVAAAFGIAWMGLAEGLISKPLAVCAGGLAALSLLAVAITGVPGLPFVMSLGITITGVWLTLGRSPITLR
jgi:hypothetical protein